MQTPSPILTLLKTLRHTIIENAVLNQALTVIATRDYKMIAIL